MRSSILSDLSIAVRTQVSSLRKTSIPGLLALAFGLFGTAAVQAQGADRVPDIIDSSKLVTLAGHHPQWASAANSLRPVPASQTVEGLTLVLARSPEQESAFEKLLAAQQDPASPEYHHWLTPAQVGEQFGLSAHDVAAVSAWLRAQGLQVTYVAPSRIFLGFSGTAAQLGSAFHTELHMYNVHGVERMSVATDPKLPASIASVVKAVRGLYAIDEHPYHAAKSMHMASPDVSLSNGDHFLTPADFAAIYDLPASATGSGETIGIVGESRTDFADFTEFRGLTGTTFANPTEIVPTAFGGIDPGPAYTAPPASGVSIDAQTEATLDVLRAGSVANGAKIDLVVASQSSGGIGDDAQYLVQTTPLPAQVMSISFGACESEAGASSVSFWDALFQQAASQGMSVFVSSGDAGASGCDTNFATPPASPAANSPNYICSSSYATCVGGTEFNDTADPTQYWSTSNSSDLESALGYIPEGAWNEPLNSDSDPDAAASGGGVSSIIATPSWQTGTGVPSARTGRYTPDVAFSASGHDGYFGCFAAAGANCVPNSQGEYEFEYFFGTSAAAPAMAGIAAILDGNAGAGQGNLNPGLYALAASTPTAFHDVTVASSGVTGCTVDTPSMCNNSIPGPTGLSGGQAGYLIGDGYDEVTGLGSLDVSVFLNSLSTLPAPQVTVTAPATVTTAESLTVKVAVTAPSGITAVPAGTVTVTGGGYTSVAAPLSSGSASITIPAGSLPAGSDTLTATYSGDSNFQSATGAVTVQVTAVVAPSFSIKGTAVSVSPGATTSNTSTVTVTPAGGFTGTVALTAAVTSSPTGAVVPPTLSFGTTGSVAITGTGNGTATLTVSTTEGTVCGVPDPSAASANSAHWFAAGGVALAGFLMLGFPALRRKRLFPALLLLAAASVITACGGGSGKASCNVATPGTTAGTYTITVTGTSGSTTSTGTVTLTVQ